MVAYHAPATALRRVCRRWNQTICGTRTWGRLHGWAEAFANSGGHGGHSAEALTIVLPVEIDGHDATVPMSMPRAGVGMGRVRHLALYVVGTVPWDDGRGLRCRRFPPDGDSDHDQPDLHRHRILHLRDALIAAHLDSLVVVFEGDMSPGVLRCWLNEFVRPLLLSHPAPATLEFHTVSGAPPLQHDHAYDHHRHTYAYEAQRHHVGRGLCMVHDPVGGSGDCSRWLLRVLVDLLCLGAPPPQHHRSTTVDWLVNVTADRRGLRRLARVSEEIFRRWGGNPVRIDDCTLTLFDEDMSLGWWPVFFREAHVRRRFVLTVYAVRTDSCTAVVLDHLCQSTGLLGTETLELCLGVRCTATMHALQRTVELRRLLPHRHTVLHVHGVVTGDRGAWAPPAVTTTTTLPPCRHHYRQPASTPTSTTAVVVNAHLEVGDLRQGAFHAKAQWATYLTTVLCPVGLHLTGLDVVPFLLHCTQPCDRVRVAGLDLGLMPLVDAGPIGAYDRQHPRNGNHQHHGGLVWINALTHVLMRTLPCMRTLTLVWPVPIFGVCHHRQRWQWCHVLRTVLRTHPTLRHVTLDVCDALRARHAMGPPLWELCRWLVDTVRTSHCRLHDVILRLPPRGRPTHHHHGGDDPEPDPDNPDDPDHDDDDPDAPVRWLVRETSGPDRPAVSVTVRDRWEPTSTTSVQTPSDA